jgi:hypothetical protein
MEPRRERIEHWVSDFLESPRFRVHASLVREYAPEVLVAFLEAACAARDLEPADLEEPDIKPGLLEGVARLDIPGSVREGIPALVAAFLEEMEAQGRLAGGRALGRYATALADAYLEAGAGRGPDLTRTAPKVGRNDPCPCGSGLKYKRCCLGRL